jgi:hypothetical protein
MAEGAWIKNRNRNQLRSKAIVIVWFIENEEELRMRVSTHAKHIGWVLIGRARRAGEALPAIFIRIPAQLFA